MPYLTDREQFELIMTNFTEARKAYAKFRAKIAKKYGDGYVADWQMTKAEQRQSRSIDHADAAASNALCGYLSRNISNRNWNSVPFSDLAKVTFNDVCDYQSGRRA